MAEDNVRRSKPEDHHPPEKGKWGLYRFTWEDTTRLGWKDEKGNGKGVLRDLDRWLKACRPDSIDDIQAVYAQSEFRNYVGTIYCKGGDGNLEKLGPIVSMDIRPWKDPGPEGNDPIQELLFALRDARFRVIGCYYSAGGGGQLYCITAGPNAGKFQRK
jgi:hypothetical protein